MAFKLLSLSFVSACMLFLSGCWDRIEIQNMLMVAGIGLDRGGDGKGFDATVEIVCIESSGGEQTMEPEIVKGKGETVYAAVQNAMETTGGVMYGNHCKVMVIGEELAREGIDDIVDYILHSNVFHKSMEVMVAGDTTASEIMTGELVKNDILSHELARITANNAKHLNNTSKTGMYKLREAVLSPSGAAVVPAVFLKEQAGEKNKDEEKNEDKDEDNRVICVEGLGVMLDGKLQGFLSGEQSNIYNIIMSQVKNGYLVFEEEERPVGAKILSSKTRVTPDISQDKLSATISTDTKASLNGISNAGEIPLNNLQAKLTGEIESLIKDVQSKFGADIFDFYKEFEDVCRDEWKTLRQDWRTRFKEMEIKVT